MDTAKKEQYTFRLIVEHVLEQAKLAAEGKTEYYTYDEIFGDEKNKE